MGRAKAIPDFEGSEKRTMYNLLLFRTVVSRGAGGALVTPGIWEFCSPYSNQRGQIMLTTLLLAPLDLKT